MLQFDALLGEGLLIYPLVLFIVLTIADLWRIHVTDEQQGVEQVDR